MHLGFNININKLFFFFSSFVIRFPNRRQSSSNELCHRFTFVCVLICYERSGTAIKRHKSAVDEGVCRAIVRTAQKRFHNKAVSLVVENWKLPSIDRSLAPHQSKHFCDLSRRSDRKQNTRRCRKWKHFAFTIRNHRHTRNRSRSWVKNLFRASRAPPETVIVKSGSRLAGIMNPFN